MLNKICGVIAAIIIIGACAIQFTRHYIACYKNADGSLNYCAIEKMPPNAKYKGIFD